MVYNATPNNNATFNNNSVISQGRIQGGGGGGGGAPARAPPKIGKNIIFWRKIEIFHTKYPKNFRASLRNRKKYAFFVVKS